MNAQKVSKGAMWLGLGAVAVACAVVSFNALGDLGAMSAFGGVNWMLPVVLDAGALSGSLVWLGRWAPRPARRYARVLALALLGLSVGGNALSHGLSAEHVTPHWIVVVVVSAIPPAVLGAVVHLAVLATDRPTEQAEQASEQSLNTSPNTPANIPAGKTSDRIDEVLVQRQAAPRVQRASGSKPVSLSDPGTVADFLEWAAELDHTPSTYEVRQRMSCGHTRAKKLLDELDQAAAS